MLPDGGGGTAEYCSPLKMIEYLSAGRSIIASNLPSIAEIMVDESNCLLVEPESVDEWCAAVARLASDAALARASRARCSRDRRGAHYPWTCRPDSRTGRGGEMKRCGT